MWWNHAGYGPMYGWWFMPIFGLFCMLIFVYFLSRIFGRNGGGCGPFNRHTSRGNPGEDELQGEIGALCREVEELKNQEKMPEGGSESDRQKLLHDVF